MLRALAHSCQEVGAVYVLCVLANLLCEKQPKTEHKQEALFNMSQHEDAGYVYAHWPTHVKRSVRSTSHVCRPNSCTKVQPRTHNNLNVAGNIDTTFGFVLRLYHF